MFAGTFQPSYNHHFPRQLLHRRIWITFRRVQHRFAFAKDCRMSSIIYFCWIYDFLSLHPTSLALLAWKNYKSDLFAWILMLKPCRDEISWASEHCIWKAQISELGFFSDYTASKLTFRVMRKEIQNLLRFVNTRFFLSNPELVRNSSSGFVLEMNVHNSKTMNKS